MNNEIVDGKKLFQYVWKQQSKTAISFMIAFFIIIVGFTCFYLFMKPVNLDFLADNRIVSTYMLVLGIIHFYASFDFYTKNGGTRRNFSWQVC